MIFGLEPIVFISFLSWPFTYIVVAIIIFLIMGKNDKKEEAWEAAFEKWQKSLPESERVAQVVPTEGGAEK